MLCKRLSSFDIFVRNGYCLKEKVKGFCKSSVVGVEKQEDLSNNDVLLDKDENITLIGINRPKQRNAITFQAAEKLSNAISSFEEDDTSPIAVLYGTGGTFSAGYDVKEIEMQSQRGSLDFLLRHEGSVGPTRRHSKKTIICAINGFCVASGLELALMCDLRVMEDTAVLGFFNRRFGVPISDGGTVRLSSIVGYSHALDLILSGRRVTSKEALNMGLVDRVVATGTALGQAVNLAFCIAKYPQASLTKDRNSLYTNTYSSHGFRSAIQTEVMNTSREVLMELKKGVQRFKKSEADSPLKEIHTVKEKFVPEWEKREIDFEKNENKKY